MNKFKINKHSYQEQFEDTTRVIIIRISQKNRHHDGQEIKYKRTNNDLHKTKDGVTRSPLKTGGEFRNADNDFLLI